MRLNLLSRFEEEAVVRQTILRRLNPGSRKWKESLHFFSFLIFNYNLLAAVFVHRTLCAETRQSVLCNQA